MCPCCLNLSTYSILLTNLPILRLLSLHRRRIRSLVTLLLGEIPVDFSPACMRGKGGSKRLPPELGAEETLEIRSHGRRQVKFRIAVPLHFTLHALSVLLFSYEIIR